MIYKKLFTCALILVFFISFGVNGCSKYRVNKCMDPIIDLRRRLGIPDEVEYFPLYKLDDQAFVDYCKAGKTSAECLKTMQGCSQVDRDFLDGLAESFHYICNEVLEDYKKYQPCYASYPVVSKLKHCREANKQKVANTAVRNKKSAICGVIEDQVPCVRKAIEPECGTEAADLQVNYAKKVLEPMAKAIDCNSEKWPMWKIMLIIGAVCCGLGMLSFFVKHAILSLKERSINYSDRNTTHRTRENCTVQERGYLQAPVYKQTTDNMQPPPVYYPPPGGYVQAPINPPAYSQIYQSDRLNEKPSDV